MAKVEVVDKKSGKVISTDANTDPNLSGAVVKLYCNLDEVESYSNHEGDLVIVLVSGDVINIDGFFLPTGEERNDLFIEDEQGLVWWGQYSGEWENFSFTEILPEDDDGFPAWVWWLGIGAAGLLAASAGGGGGGSSSESSQDTVTPQSTVTPVTNSADVGGRAPSVTVSEDLNDDGFLSASESAANSDGDIDVTIGLPAGAVAGDTIQVTDGTDTQNIVLTAGDITAGTVTTSFPNPPVEGETLTVTAVLVDQNDNTSSPGSDSVTVDTSADNDGDGFTVTIDSITDDTGTAGDFITADNTLLISGTVDVDDGNTLSVTVDGTTYTVGDGFLSLANSPDGNGNDTWTLDLTATTLGDGSYPLEATVTDAIGNTQSATQTVVIDTASGADGSAPTVTIAEDLNDDGYLSASESAANSDGDIDVTIGLPAGAVAGDTILVTDGTDTQNIVLTAGDITAGTVTTSFPNLPAENETLTVTAVLIDQIGNTSAPGSDSVTVDTTADNDGDGFTVTIDSITDDTGTAGDFITADNTLLISGTVDVDDGNTLIVTVDGTTYTVGDGFLSLANSPDGNGNDTWTLDLTATTLGDGTYPVQATVTDAIGNTGTASQDVVIDTGVDTDSDGFSVTIDSITDDTGTAGDFITADNTLLISGTVDVDDGNVLSVLVDGTTYTVGDGFLSLAGSPDGNGNDTWTLDLTGSPLSDGTYPVVATVTNMSGFFISDTRDVIIDTAAGDDGSAPTVTIAEDLNDDGFLSASESAANSDGDIDVTIGLPAGAVAGDTIQVTDGTDTQNIVLTAGDITAGTVTTSFPNLPAENETLTVTAVLIDQIGNTSAPGSDSVTVDTSADNDGDGFTVTIDSITNDTGTAGDFITADNTLLISGTVDVDDGNTLNVKVDGTTYTVGDGFLSLANSPDGNGNDTWTLDLTATTLGDGTYPVEATVTDAIGNTGTASQDVVIDTGVDTDADGFSVTIDSITDDTGTAGDFITADNTLLISGTVDVDDGNALSVTVDGTTYTVGDGFLSLAGSPDGNGNDTWTLDLTGSPLSDGTYPVVATVTNMSGFFISDTRDVIIDTAAGDDGSAPTVTIAEDLNDDGFLSASESAANSDGDIDVTIGLPAGAVAGDTIQVTDGTDTQNIVLTAGDITAGTVTTSFPNLPAENETLTVTAVLIDQIGNTSAPGSDSVTVDTSADNDGDGFTVTIDSITDDTGTAGDFITADNTLLISGTVDVDDGNTLSVTVDGTTYTVGDGFLSLANSPDGNGNDTWTLDLTATTLGDGTYPVQATVTDAIGNTRTANQNVIIDSVAPVFTAASASVSEEGLSNGNADTTGTPTDTTNSTSASGTLGIADSSLLTAVAVSGPAGITSAGEAVNWTGNFTGDTYTLTGVRAVGGETVATLTLDTAGAYTLTLLQSLDHPLNNIEDILELTFNVTATDVAGNQSSADALTIFVEDDMPIAADITQFDISSLPVDTPLTGSFVDSYGADGGYVSEVKLEGFSLTFDSVNETVSESGVSSLLYDYSYNSTTNELTVRTVKGEELVVDMFAGDYSYTSADPFISVVPDAAPEPLLADDQALLGLVGVEALNLVDFSNQLFSVTDINNNITDVSIDLTAINISLGAGFEVAGAALLAAELGLTYDNSNDLALLDTSAGITITSSTPGETIDELRLNEFLGAIYFESSVLNLGLASTFTISAEDSTGLTGSDSQSNLTELGLLQSNEPDYMEIGTTGADALTGTSGSDRLYGFAGDDTLSSGAGNDLLRGGSGDDELDGSSGNDLLIGGQGDDLLTGGDADGSGNDIFLWEFGDQSVTAGLATAAHDTITDFAFTPVSSGGDILDLGHLLQGEGVIGTNPGNLARYLHFIYDGTDTVVYVSSAGNFDGGYDSVNDPASVDQIITLTGVDLRAGFTADYDIIANLLQQGNLIVDEATADTDFLGSNTTFDAVITDNDGDTASSQVIFDSTGATPPAPSAFNVAPVVQADTTSLLGIARAEALTAIDINTQDLTAADADGNLRQVTIAYEPLLSANLVPLYLTASSQLATELGLQFSVANDNGLLGLVAPSSVLTIVAQGGGDLDNLAINELLATVQFSNSADLLGLDVNLQASVLDSITITGADSEGLEASDSLGDLLNASALNTLLGDNSDLVEGTSGNDTLSSSADSPAGSDGERFYGYAGNDTINAEAGNDLIRGGAGDDTLNGGAGNDLIIDGNGADSIDAGDGDDLIWLTGTGFASVDGGSGFDALLLDGGIDLNPGAIAGTINNIEEIDLGDEDGASVLTLTEAAVLSLTDVDNELRISGDASDSVLATGAVFEGSLQIDGDSYNQYTLNSATLYIEDEISNVVIA